MNSVFEAISDSMRRRKAVAVCTVIATSGSVPLKAGAKMLVWNDGRTLGTIGGGNIEKQVTEDAKEHLALGKSSLKEYHLLDLEMCCGGTMNIFIDSIKVPRQLIVFGAGHIGRNIVSFAENLDFSIVVIDNRETAVAALSKSTATVFHLDYDAAVNLLTFDKDTYIVICTHRHEYDKGILAHCIQKPHAYLGMIGSRRKVFITRKRFLEKGFCTGYQFDQVDSPIGFDFGQNSPGEIALGIVAKLVAVANGRNTSIDVIKKDYEIHSDSHRCS